eukprot:scpid45806/ scgid33341/ JmjC domain-containing protein 8; Jumonji domain-containing protein 8
MKRSKGSSKDSPQAKPTSATNSGKSDGATSGGSLIKILFVLGTVVAIVSVGVYVWQAPKAAGKQSPLPSEPPVKHPEEEHHVVNKRDDYAAEINEEETSQRQQQQQQQHETERKLEQESVEDSTDAENVAVDEQPASQVDTEEVDETLLPSEPPAEQPTISDAVAQSDPEENNAQDEHQDHDKSADFPSSDDSRAQDENKQPPTEEQHVSQEQVPREQEQAPEEAQAGSEPVQHNAEPHEQQQSHSQVDDEEGNRHADSDNSREQTEQQQPELAQQRGDLEPEQTQEHQAGKAAQEESESELPHPQQQQQQQEKEMPEDEPAEQDADTIVQAEQLKEVAQTGEQQQQSDQQQEQPVQQQEQQETQQQEDRGSPDGTTATSPESDSSSAPPPLSADDAKREAAIKQLSKEANLTCDQWMEKARKMMIQGQANYAAALDTLAMCVFQEPKNAAATWNMAVLLVKMNRTAEALVQMENAIASDPKNKEFRQGAGTLLFSMKVYPQATKALETYLELNLYTESWPTMMEDIYWQREDELVFLKEADDYDTMLLSMSKLLRCYLETRALRKADRMYQILITLYEHDHDMMENFATFSFGLGNMWNGVRFMKTYMEHQFYHNKMGTIQEAYDVMTAHMLRLATSGFDANIVNLARSLLLAGTNALEMIREACGSDLLPGFNEQTHTIYESDLVDTLGACILDQRLAGALLQAGASKVANNIFGWSSLLHGVHLGHAGALKSMIDEGLDVSHRTLLGMTSLHVAALRGHSNIVPQILSAGVKVSEKDEYGRTAMDYVCELRYAASEFSASLNVPLPANCPTPVLKTGSSPLQAAGGEWLDTYREVPQALLTDSCDIDSIPADTTGDEFFRNYLSLQKPVIIRHGLSNWAELKRKLQRRAVDREYGSLLFKRSTVPYADTFGLEHSVSSLHDYLGYLSQLAENEKDGNNAQNAEYIFTSLAPDHPMRPLFKEPDALDPNATHISTQSVQFYVGPALTGAPPHFHNFAWNGLVYGAKRWFIFPPQKSLYSKQPVLDWYKTYTHGSTLECTQHAGDVLFVPALWAHAVINLKESVGFASEFIYGAAEFSI